jgi:cytochrome b
MTSPQPERPAPVRLWDWPTRLIHWALVVLIPCLWWTWRNGNIALHEQLGYLAIGLLLFRLLWGFVGASTARFAGFVRGPRAVAGYVRNLFSRAGEPVVGHNPLGGWSVLVLLGLLIAELSFGLFTQDVDGIESGPLARYVSYDTADAARHWHGLIFDLLLWMIGIHVAAILFYWLVKRDNLVGPMLTGRKRMAGEPPAVTFAPLWRVAAVALIAAGVVFWLSRGAPL